MAHSHLCLPPSNIFGWVSNLIHEHCISQNNLFNEPLVLTAVFKTGHGKRNRSVENCPCIQAFMPAPHSISFPRLLSSFKNTEDIMNGEKDVIYANEGKKISWWDSWKMKNVIIKQGLNMWLAASCRATHPADPQPHLIHFSLDFLSDSGWFMLSLPSKRGKQGLQMLKHVPSHSAWPRRSKHRTCLPGTDTNKKEPSCNSPRILGAPPTQKEINLKVEYLVLWRGFQGRVVNNGAQAKDWCWVLITPPGQWVPSSCQAPLGSKSDYFPAPLFPATE